MSLAESVLRCLGQGQVRLRQDLCQELNIYPEELAAACRELTDLGLVFRDAGADSLQLAAAIDWLDPVRLRSAASTLGLDLAITGLCASTNLSLAGDLDQRQLPCALLAEGQSGGRGRRGRGWSSPPGGGIYLSIAWRCPRPLTELAALGLIASLAAARALNGFDLPPVKVKWPNDLQVGGRKLGGCLVDVSGAATGPSEVVIGLGINVQLPATTGIDQPWTDLHQLGCTADRTSLACALLEQLVQALRTFDTHGSQPLLADWPDLDALFGQTVEVSWDDGRRLLGTASGIDALGRLRITAADGKHHIHSGDIRVRAA